MRPRMNTVHQRALHRYAVLTACATLVLLAAGALVTSNDAGLAVPDWPLSYGSLWPPLVGGILYEHGHRLVAGFVGLLTIGLAVWLQLREPRAWVRRLGWAALGAVVAQGLLGGITVLFYLPPAVSIAHATLAQMFFASVVSLSVFTGRWWQAEQQQLADHGSPSLLTLSRLVLAAILAQLVLGAAYRHNVLGIVGHLVGAGVVVALAVYIARAIRNRFPQVAALRRAARVLLALVGLQVLLGGGAYWAIWGTQSAPQPMPAMVYLTVAHLALGALTLAAAVVVALRAQRLLRPVAAEQLAGVARFEQGAAR